MDDAVYVVVPAFDERPVIGETLAGLVPLGHEVVVVDDGSSDGTADEAERWPVHVLRHRVNLGQGASLRTGTSYALERGARAVVHFDADGQHAPESVSALLAPVLAGEADVALGSRFLLAEHARAVPPLRRATLRAARVFHGLTTGLWLSDAHNGLRALSAAAAGDLPIREDRMAHASELVSLIRRRGLRYVEVPTPIRYSEHSLRKGQSSLGAVNVVIDLILRKVFR